MRGYVKKKKYADHVRQQTLAELISRPDGNWAHNDVNLTDKCRKFVYEGTRGGSGKR